MRRGGGVTMSERCSKCGVMHVFTKYNYMDLCEKCYMLELKKGEKK
jgi:hypothetical protein